MPRLMRESGAARLVAVMMVAGGAFFALSGIAFAQKVASNPSTVALTEGQSQDVHFALDAPIITPTGTVNPNVTINFTVGDPSRVSLSSSSIVWTVNEWFELRTLTVNALLDGVHDSSNTVVVQFQTVSQSVYYDGFSGSFTVDLTDLDPPPPTTTTTTTAASTTTTPLSSSSTTPLTSAPGATSTSIASPIAVSAASGDGGNGELPDTGSTGSTAIVGVVLLIAGALLLGLTRRRRTAD